MPTILDYRQCPQCGYEKADAEFACHTSEERTDCRRCGYRESYEAEWDGENLVGYTHNMKEGAGVLFYRWKGAIGYSAYYLATQEEVTEAAKWLRDRLASGETRPSSPYVSRWNPNEGAVEFVIGVFFEPGSYDPDDEMAEQLGPSDLRPFQLLQKRWEVQLRYGCGHVLDGRILLLEGQPEPRSETVFDTHLPCLACIPQFTNTGEGGVTQELPRRRLWENRELDGTSNSVTPAFNHPDNLEESASLFYAAFPERKRMHPQSIGYQLQLEGWSDEDIAAKKWLSSPLRNQRNG